MRIAIIGAGWFGCHIASELLEKGFEVRIFEKEDDIFKGASTYNTGRLHLGFHYPRSYVTRNNCKYHFELFKNKYHSVCEPTENNFYFIANKTSVIDFGTYLQILDSSGLAYDKINVDELGLKNIEGGISCEEYAINAVKAKSIFKEKLSNHLVFNSPISELKEKGDKVLVGNESFDFVINSTYFNYLPNDIESEVVYENVVSLLLKPRNEDVNWSFVLMDGDFFSLNRFFTSDESENLYSLYHVKTSVVKRFDNFQSALNHQLDIKEKPLDEIVNLNEIKESVNHFYPNFENDFEIVGRFLSIRTKLNNKNANRECIVTNQNRIIDVLSGKINSIFAAADKVLEIIDEIQKK